MRSEARESRAGEGSLRCGPVGGRAGFSLVELLVSVVITGLVGAAITGLFMEQSGFYQTNSRQVSANKSLRGTADRMSTELRMVRQGDVLTAEADRLEVRYGVTSGVVCHTGASTVYVYLHRLPGESDPSTVRYLEPRFTGSWQTGLLWGDLDVDGGQECASHGAPSGAGSDRYREVTSWPGSMPADGSLVYGTVPLTYEFDVRNGRLALLRDGEQLAAPFEESDVYFRYFREDGTELSAPVTGGSRDDIAYVQVEATARGQDPSEQYRGDRRIRLRIPFRN